MIRNTLFAAAALSLLASAPATAAPCKDARGRFIKCATAKPAPQRCKLNGRFAKCGTPGARPI